LERFIDLTLRRLRAEFLPDCHPQDRRQTTGGMPAVAAPRRLSGDLPAKYLLLSL